jgi:hypothetical protein
MVRRFVALCAVLTLLAACGGQQAAPPTIAPTGGPAPTSPTAT